MVELNALDHLTAIKEDFKRSTFLHSCFYASGADGVSEIQVLVLFLDHHMINIDPGLLLQVINHIVIMF